MTDRIARARAGFSLVELLIVVGVLSLLVAVLAPSLWQSRETARAALCLTRLRALAQANHAYAGQGDGRLCPSHQQRVMNGAMHQMNWDFTSTTRWQGGRAVTTVRLGLVWGRDGAVSDALQCPSFDGASNTAADPRTGFNYNASFLGREGVGGRPPIPARPEEAARPGDTAMFGDGQYAAGANKFMRSPLASPTDVGFNGRWAGTQGYRHLGMTHVAFLDGHAEPLGQRFTGGPADTPHVTEDTGFLSVDNELYDLE